MTEPCSRRHSAGFTLIEVVVALAVLAIAFGFAFDALSGGLHWLDRDGERQRALAVASSTLARVGHDIALRDGEIAGRTRDGFTWRIVTAPWGDSAGVPAGALIGHRVAVSVGWRDGRHRRHVRLVTLRLAPKEPSR